MFYLALIGTYFGIGILALAILEANTHKISRNLDRATQETQTAAINAGYYLNPKVARIVIIATTVLFWPTAIYGYLESQNKTKNKSGGVNNDQSK
jgi:GR25 family glycosyltransferase involved in LPS biosynthesis